MTPEERAAEIVYHCGEPWADLSSHAKDYLRDQIADAIRAAEDDLGKVAEKSIADARALERERCAQVAESLPFADHEMNDGRTARIAAAIRAPGTNAALASASALFGVAPVQPGEPTIADALTCGSKALRDLASGTNTAGVSE